MCVILQERCAAQATQPATPRMAGVDSEEEHLLSECIPPLSPTPSFSPTPSPERVASTEAPASPPGPPADPQPPLRHRSAAGPPPLVTPRRRAEYRRWRWREQRDHTVGGRQAGRVTIPPVLSRLVCCIHAQRYYDQQRALEEGEPTRGPVWRQRHERPSAVDPRPPPRAVPRAHYRPSVPSERHGRPYPPNNGRGRRPQRYHHAGRLWRNEPQHHARHRPSSPTPPFGVLETNDEW